MYAKPSFPHNIRSLFCFLFLLLLPLSFLGNIVKLLHYSLPTPSVSCVDDSTGLPVFSESRALDVIHHLADTIGYRILGTREMKQAEDFVWDSVNQIKSAFDASPLAGFHEIEIWYQHDSGQHLFNFMDKDVWKKYFLGNIIVRLSDGSEQSKANSILVNAHIDSTLPSPGAADDGAGIGVMMEALRVMANTPRQLHNSAIFLFNGGEESLQDASHLFITKNPLRKTVRAVINLEACGTTGPEILFQATSRQMIEAYSHVPHPFGTVLATEIFGTGVILSDTDFRQFVEYGNLTGLDMALIKNSYFYHTRRDTTDNIERGALQHMGENTLALLNYLTSDKSDLTQIEASSDTVFFSALGGYVFVVMSSELASSIYIAIAFCIAYFIRCGISAKEVPVLLAALFSVPASFVGSLACANLVAFFMDSVLQKPLSWFRHEYYSILLFAPPTVAGALAIQVWFSRYTKGKPDLGLHNQKREYIVMLASALFYLLLALFGQFMRVMSSYLPALTSGSLLIGGIINDNFFAKPGYISIATYTIAQIIPVIMGLDNVFTCVDLFVPLTGRLGVNAPADNIVAIVVAVTVFSTIPMILPFAHRFGEKVLIRMVIALSVLTITTMALFASPDWKVFDADHPKRLLILHMENITSETMSYHVASLDRTPSQNFMEHTISSMGVHVNSLTHQNIDTEIPDWDIIFPVSQFLRAYKVELPQPPASYHSAWKNTFTVRVEDDKLDTRERTRHFKLIVDHSGVIWPVISFEADVVDWDFPEPPERGFRRHHVKESSSYGHSEWSITMTIKLDDLSFQAALREFKRRNGQLTGTSQEDAEISKLKIWYSGLDKSGFYPHHAKNREENRSENDIDRLISESESYEIKPSMVFFERLEKVLPDDVDASLWSAISGVIKL